MGIVSGQVKIANLTGSVVQISHEMSIESWLFNRDPCNGS